MKLKYGNTYKDLDENNKIMNLYNESIKETKLEDKKYILTNATAILPKLS